VSQKASTELALLVAVLFMVLVGYHAERARTATGETEPPAAADADTEAGAGAGADDAAG
jgi:hypothetical protein